MVETSTGPTIDPAAEGWILYENSGLEELVGPIWSRQEDRYSAFAFLSEPRHRNSFGIVHGGVIMTFADHCVGLAGWKHAGGEPGVTIQLNTLFVAPARIGSFVEVRAGIIRRTRSLMFIRGEVSSQGKILTSVEGIWKHAGDRQA